MAYNNTTPGIYKIPYWARGERASEQSNLRAAQIIENQIKASNQFFGANGVIQEGGYTGVFSSGASSVVLAPTAITPAIEAVINFKYANQNNNLQWTGLPNSSTIYLYAQALEQNIYLNGQISTLQFGQCVAVWNTSGSTPPESILLARVITTTTAITVDSSASITDNGDYIAGKPIYYSFGAHRTAIPIDHPNLSVTDVKLANQAVLSRTIAPWDGISSGTDVVNGKGIATGHLKDKSVSNRKLGLTTGENIPITGAIDLTGFMYISSGLSTGSLQVKGSSVHFSGIDVYSSTTLRGNATVQGTLTSNDLVSATSTLSLLRSQTVASSGLDIYTPTMLVRGVSTFQDLITSTGFANRQNLQSGLTSATSITTVSGIQAQGGYTGRVAFYRQSVGYIQDPLNVNSDNIILPPFLYPATITEVLVQSRLAATSNCSIELHNAINGGGSSITATLHNSDRFASGVGLITIPPITGQIVVRPSSITCSLSGINVFITGYQQIPFPSVDIN